MTRQQLALAAARSPAVSAVVHRPDQPCGRRALVLPGAGGDLDTEGVVALAEVLAALGVTVVRANLPFRELGRRPPRAESSVDDAAAVLTAAAALLDATDPACRGDWILAGRSYGARVLSLLCAADGPDVEPVAGLLCSGYPLHPPGRPDRCRVDHWPRIAVPCAFLQGDRDPFGGPDELAVHTGALAGPATIVPVAGGDHSLRVTRAAAADGRAAGPAASTWGCRDAVAAWLATLPH